MPSQVLVLSWRICGELLAFGRVLVTAVLPKSKDVLVKQRDLFSNSVRRPKDILRAGGSWGRFGGHYTVSTPR